MTHFHPNQGVKFCFGTAVSEAVRTHTLCPADMKPEAGLYVLLKIHDEWMLYIVGLKCLAHADLLKLIHLPLCKLWFLC